MKAKLSGDWSLHFVDAWEIAENEFEPPVFRLVLYDENEVGYDVKEFAEFPTSEEVYAALASFRKVHR